MTDKLKHLYIHIPFCKNICAYCDFIRQLKDDKVVNTYLTRIIKEIDNIKNKLTTIYIGGGTPNCLNDTQLNLLLKHAYAKLNSKYEFTIELNPELISRKQATILKLNGVNRVSIGAQTTNNAILHQFNRQHALKHVIQAISNLKKVGITNINLDFMYGFNEMKPNDIISAINFIKTHQVKHVSWYALELKENSKLAHDGYKLNEDLVEQHLKLIIKHMHKINFKRYEVSSWSKTFNYESIHNKAYWLTNDWKAIGYGGWGLENIIYYENVGNVNEWWQSKQRYNTHDYYLHILLMGLRLKDGLNLKNKIYFDAYKHFKNKLKFVHIKNNHLIADNLNLLNECLVDLV